MRTVSPTIRLLAPSRPTARRRLAAVRVPRDTSTGYPRVAAPDLGSGAARARSASFELAQGSRSSSCRGRTSRQATSCRSVATGGARLSLGRSRPRGFRAVVLLVVMASKGVAASYSYCTTASYSYSHDGCAACPFIRQVARVQLDVGCGHRHGPVRGCARTAMTIPGLLGVDALASLILAHRSHGGADGVADVRADARADARAHARADAHARAHARAHGHADAGTVGDALLHVPLEAARAACFGVVRVDLPYGSEPDAPIWLRSERRLHDRLGLLHVRQCMDWNTQTAYYPNVGPFTLTTRNSGVRRRGQLAYHMYGSTMGTPCSRRRSTGSTGRRSGI